MGFKTQVFVTASTEKEAINKTKLSFENKAKLEKWEHPKQIDQGFRAEINVEIESNENATQILLHKSEIEWVKMNGLK